MIRLHISVQYSYEECECEVKNYKKYGEKHRGKCKCKGTYWSNDKWFDDIPPIEYTLTIWGDRTEAIFDTKNETYTNDYMEWGTYYDTILTNPSNEDIENMIIDFNDFNLGGMELYDYEYERDLQFERDIKITKIL